VIGSPVEEAMRISAIFLAGFVALASGATLAQSSPPFYINRESRFAVIFPGPPAVKDVSFPEAAGASVPAREFSFEQDGNRHVVTVVEFPTGRAVDEAIVDRAADALRMRGEVRFQAADDYDPGLPGRQLNIFQSDGRQLRASVYMWDHRLYITEASGTPGTPSLLQFEQSITLLNADGSEVNLGF
jgi:hypothetical protein